MQYKALACSLLLAAASTAAMAKGYDFSIEDESLSAVPAPVEAAVRKSKGFKYTECKLIGKAVDLSGQDAQSGFAVTTDDACGWGAALGPIWIVRQASQPVVVISEGSYGLTFGPPAHGLRSITFTAGTAGWTREAVWKFNGSRYVQVKARQIPLEPQP